MPAAPDPVPVAEKQAFNTIRFTPFLKYAKLITSHSVARSRGGTMPRILLVADQIEALEELAQSLSTEKEVELLWAHDGKTALESVATNSPALVVVDASIGGESGLELIQRLIGVDAFIQTAAVSPLPHDAFHEASEGLGVMAQLPPHPIASDARQLLQTLRQYL
jgi:CheY-like chemotaxis protein